MCRTMWPRSVPWEKTSMLSWYAHWLAHRFSFLENPDAPSRWPYLCSLLPWPIHMPNSCCTWPASSSSRTRAIVSPRPVPCCRFLTELVRDRSNSGSWRIGRPGPWRWCCWMRCRWFKTWLNDAIIIMMSLISYKMALHVVLIWGWKLDHHPSVSRSKQLVNGIHPKMVSISFDPSGCVGTEVRRTFAILNSQI